MINAWALAAEVLYGDMDETYPIINPSEMKLRDKTMKLSEKTLTCLLYTSPSPRDFEASRMPSSA